MKRIIIISIVIGFLAVLMGSGKGLLGDIFNLEDPLSVKIEPNDWLSKLAVEHYGDATFWRELALVNRAPNPDLIFPAEQVTIPSKQAIEQIRQARSLSEVNRLVSEQQAILAKGAEPRTAPAPKSSQESRSPAAAPNGVSEEDSAMSQADANSDGQTEQIADPKATKPDGSFPQDEKGSTDGYSPMFGLSGRALTLTVFGAMAIILVTIFLLASRKNERNQPFTGTRSATKTGNNGSNWEPGSEGLPKGRRKGNKSKALL